MDVFYVFGVFAGRFYLVIERVETCSIYLWNKRNSI